MSDFDFQLYKTTGLISVFALVFIAQLIFPYKDDFRQVLKNSRTNFSLAAINIVIVSLLCAGCVCSVAMLAEEKGYGILNLLNWPLWTRIVFAVCVLDFVAFGWHWANHRIKFLWRFHAVHHSDSVFDASTAFRFHPGEILISLGVRLLVVVSLGLPVPGILLFEIVYGFFNTFEHGNIRCGRRFERALAFVFITPALHRKHHSDNLSKLNRNFGTIFSFWDRLFGRYLESSSVELIHVGLPGQDCRTIGVGDLLALPARDLQ